MKIAKTYRLDDRFLNELDEVINHWSKELLQTPGQNRKTSATAMIEFLIHQEYMKLLEIPDEGGEI